MSIIYLLCQATRMLATRLGNSFLSGGSELAVSLRPLANPNSWARALVQP